MLYFIWSIDWIEIRDGGNESAPLIHRKLCGYSIPGPIVSTGNEMFLRFKSGRIDNGDNGYIGEISSGKLALTFSFKHKKDVTRKIGIIGKQYE